MLFIYVLIRIGSYFMKKTVMNRLSVFLVLMVGLCFSRDVWAAEVYLHSGDKLTCQILKRDKDGGLLVKHGVLGEFKIAGKDVKKVVLDLSAKEKAKAKAIAAVAAKKAKAAAEAAKVKAEEAKALKAEADRAWKYRIELGLNGKSGNTESLDFRTKFKAERKDDSGKLRYNLEYYARNSNGDRSANQFRAKVFREFPMVKAKKWSLFLNGQYDYDEFKSWDYRLSGNGGLGYQFMKKKNMDFTGRMGLGLRQEFGGVKDSPLKSESLFGFEYNWKITPKQTFNAKTTVYPDLSEVGEARIVSAAYWTIKIDRSRGMSLRLGIDNEYESTTVGDTKHNDFKGSVSLIYDF